MVSEQLIGSIARHTNRLIGSTPVSSLLLSRPTILVVEEIQTAGGIPAPSNNFLEDGRQLYFIKEVQIYCEERKQNGQEAGVVGASLVMATIADCENQESTTPRVLIDSRDLYIPQLMSEIQ